MFLYSYVHHRALHVLSPPFPTRRASDLCDRLHLVDGILRPLHPVAVLLECADGPGAVLAEQQIVRWKLRHRVRRSEEHTTELKSLMRISYAVFCLKQKRWRYTQLRTHGRDNG